MAAPTFRQVLRRIFDSTYEAMRITHAHDAIGDGRKVVASIGTRVVLAASTACRRVLIIAEMNNTGVITVGGATVVGALSTRQGAPLEAGDWVEFDLDNLTKIYLDTTVNGDGVTFVYFS